MRCIICPRVLRADNKNGVCYHCAGKKLSTLFNDKSIIIKLEKLLINSRNHGEAN